VTDYTPEITTAMSQGMDTEHRRRQLASESPGYGAAVVLPDNPVGPAVGKAGLLPAVGEGHSVTAEVSPSVHKAYGPDRPQYADSLVGGVGYAPVGVETALMAASRGDVTVVSPPSSPGLLARLLGKFRRPR
jgi:hypothetical protein